MTQPFVSTFEDAFQKAFGAAIEQPIMPDQMAAVSKKVIDEIHELVTTNVHNYIVDDMKGNIETEIRQHASNVVESMLMNALAGDDKTIRNLFGFNDWYMRHLYMGNRPTQWALIDAIVARRPDIFLEERLKQRDEEILQLNDRIKRLMSEVEYLKNPAV